MKKIMLKNKHSNKVRNGYPLIQKEDLQNVSDAKLVGQWVEFVSPNNDYVGTGYIGEQNKGIGWVVSHTKGTIINQDFLEKCFRLAGEKRHHFKVNDQTTAYRLFNGEGDYFGGITIDIYNEYALFSWYNASIYSHKKLFIDAFKAVFPEIKGAYQKVRFTEKGLAESEHVYGSEAPEPLLVKENGVTYATYMNEGMMTGIFLDQKEVRGLLVDGLATGKSVLNTFSYTGAFSVAAAMGGASSTVSVDLAKRSSPKTKEMFEVNGLSLDNNKIVVMDVFDYFSYAKRKELAFDMIILDPPSFARNKKRTFSVAKNYGDLVAEVSELLTKDGLLIASTNAANISYDKYVSMIEETLKANGKRFKRLDTHRLPQDFAINPNFKEGNYLKVIIYQLN
ncbi:class I SAM-dependent rRNA methyltransferase [Vagococcus sp. PNs007]|uniref:Class I SAM-dependent rRNA methyltransferase n=1 Tax=Vagococcus proximus TaxID=2991417 RepID=A0ABT5X3I3_9ENTE|nr:class I SAM-dependent rRNA methyltransferase [Vagococcus proximus]MDF0480431.1 class I SAM-dependent rRNA methyltransferase [Vagococcus proximus]